MPRAILKYLIQLPNFKKWATLEVTDFENIPAQMQSFILPGGLYAVYEHKRHSTAIFDYIFTN